MKPAPPVTSTFMAKPISSTLHPATYTVLLRRVSTMLPCLARYLRVGDVAHGREGEITDVGRIAYDGVQKSEGCSVTCHSRSFAPASARECTANFERIRWVWCRAVWALIRSSSAIAAFDFPRASSFATSSSRG